MGYDVEAGLAHASVAMLRLKDLAVLELHQCYEPVSFPYITGLLAFREIPAILKALSGLDVMPDILMVDGHGIAHPRRLGIAAHLGVLLDRPAFGVAKSRLCGKHEVLGEEKGNMQPLMDKGEQIGMVLRSKRGCNLLFISAGHRVSLETSVELTLRCLTKYRLPEPTRVADKYSKCGKGEKKQEELLLKI